jgi:uncharacterized protein (DUF2141 family)
MAGVDGGAGAHTLTVRVHGLADERGVVECVLWAGPTGFPRETANGVAKVTTRQVAQGEASCVFEGLATGTYAVSFIHDQNENGKMDTGLFGMPLEGYGFTRNPTPFMRAPRFDEASFLVESSLELRATVR